MTLFVKHVGQRNGCALPPRTCLGPVKNGGIGTAYHHMARKLVEWGHELVIAYVADNAADARRMDEARAFYAGFGVALEPIVAHPAAKTVLAQVSAPTWALYEWLRTHERPFDIVHVPEWHGLGYGSLLAKSLGLAFGETHFVIMGHAPTLWAVEGNRQLVSTERELGWVFMERRSIELADTVICVSAHLFGWMRKAGYAMPVRSFVWPNLFPAPDPSPASARACAARDGVALEEVVFIGRLEPRKGLLLFVDAIERLVRQGPGAGPCHLPRQAVVPHRRPGNHSAFCTELADRGAHNRRLWRQGSGRLPLTARAARGGSFATRELLHGNHGMPAGGHSFRRSRHRGNA